MCRNIVIKFLPWTYIVYKNLIFRQPCDSYKSQRERERQRETETERQRQRDRDRETHREN